MAGMLERIGFRVTKAASAEEGIACLKGGNFSLVITDYHMPGMNGVDLIRSARQLPGSRFTPMLLLNLLFPETGSAPPLIPEEFLGDFWCEVRRNRMEGWGSS